MTTVTQSAKARYSKAFAHITREKNALLRARKTAQKEGQQSCPLPTQSQEDTTMETTTVTYKDASAAAWEREVYAQAQALRQAFPQLGDRLESAIVLVRDGAVSLDDGVPLVESRTEPGTYWRIEGGCTCPDAQFHAPHGRCAHRIAAGLYKKVTEALEATLDWHPEAPVNVAVAAAPAVPHFFVPDPVPVAPACPEASFSVCLKGRRHGVDVLLTLRGQTRAEFLHHLQDALDVQAQLDQLCGLFDEGGAVQAEPETAHAVETPRCPYHGDMRASTKVAGTWYCAHKLFDGSYCKERFPAN